MTDIPPPCNCTGREVNKVVRLVWEISCLPCCATCYTFLVDGKSAGLSDGMKTWLEDHLLSEIESQIERKSAFEEKDLISFEFNQGRNYFFQESSRKVFSYYRDIKTESLSFLIKLFQMVNKIDQREILDCDKPFFVTVMVYKNKHV